MLWLSKYKNIEPSGSYNPCSYMDPGHYYPIIIFNDSTLKIQTAKSLWMSLLNSIVFIHRIKKIRFKKLWNTVSEIEDLLIICPPEIWYKICVFVINY